MIDLERLSALVGQIALVVIVATVATSQARSLRNDDASVSAVIPSPNQEFGDEGDYLLGRDIQRTNAAATAPVKPTARALDFPMATVEPQQQASNEAPVPIYVSPFNRAERGATIASLAPQAHFDRQESSHAPPNYAPRPSASATDLKTSASYGHHHHGGHYGHDQSGWLDMGAWTGGKGSFGWYADYPVGSKHHGYARK